MNWHDGTLALDTRPRDGDVGSLVIGAADGDDWAWGELVARFASLVTAVTVAHGLNEADSTRVTETVWRRLGRNLGKIRQPDRVATWLGAVARDECVKALTTPDASAA